jgi:hypothetical protein
MPRMSLSPQFIRAIGQILAVSYPLLALSTGARGVYQLCCKPGVSDYLAPTITTVAALCYLLATLGFIVRKPAAWRLAVGLLSFEIMGVLLVGSLTLLQPGAIGHTAWSYFGRDYGFLPLVQPILGLIWLLWRENRRAYGV